MTTIEITDEYNIVREKVIDNYNYRIILYSTGYYALQWRDVTQGNEYVDWLISPSLEKGLFKLESVLKLLEDSERLENGEYWELKLSISQEGGEMVDFSEIITREDGLGLIEKIERIAEVMKEAELYYVEDEIDIFEYIFKLICFGIIVACILLIILKLTNLL